MGTSPWAAVLQEGLGAVGGGVSAYNKNQGQRKYYDQLINAQPGIQKDISDMSSAQKTALGSLYAPALEGYQQNQSQYYDKLKNADMSQFDVTPNQPFQYDLAAETQKQMNPELQAIIDRQMGTIQQSAAGQNKLFSGAVGKNIARSTADITAKEYDAAAGRAANEEQNKYSQWTGAFQQALQAANENKANMMQGISNLGTVANQQQANWLNQGQQQMGIQNAANQGILQSKQTANGANAAKSAMGSDWMSALTGALGGAGGSGQALQNIFNAGNTQSDQSRTAQGVGSQGGMEQ